TVVAGETIRVERVLDKDGEVHLDGLPYKKGDRVELTLRRATGRARRAKRLTAKKLAACPLVGMWADRRDIPDSVAYARQLGEKAQRREGTR
ncbi:MAG: hypothetical protein H5T84_05755, partial [Thermoleophilia bacterium]|nr:hypothetical protein [Thermoleophilia bacterium]